MFEQFWQMGLAKNFSEWEAAMRMQQLPLFHTAYADRDGRIAYVYNATLPVHPTGDYRFWQGVVPGDRSDLISNTIVPYDQIPKVAEPPGLQFRRWINYPFQVMSFVHHAHRSHHHRSQNGTAGVCA